MSLASGTASIELAVFALIGLLGGAHCIGMCGPLASMYAERLDSREGGVKTGTLVRQQLSFNLGRTTGYMLSGFAFGLLGTVFYDVAAVDRYGALLRAAVGIVVGGFIISVGCYRVVGRMGSVLDLVPGGRHGGRAVSRIHQTVTARLDSWIDPSRVFVLGATHSVLPCPLLFPAFLYAFSRGNPISGALSLAVLGLSTIPTMLLYGTAIGSLSSRSRTSLHRALGISFLVLGYLPLSHGLAMLGVNVPRISVPVYQPLSIL